MFFNFGLAETLKREKFAFFHFYKSTRLIEEKYFGKRLIYLKKKSKETDECRKKLFSLQGLNLLIRHSAAKF